jgi:hypothetical protein
MKVRDLVLLVCPVNGPAAASPVVASHTQIVLTLSLHRRRLLLPPLLLQLLCQSSKVA